MRRIAQAFLNHITRAKTHHNPSHFKVISAQRIALLVTSDLVSDQRVNRTATTLAQAGYGVVAIGRRTAITIAVEPRGYSVILLKLPYAKGPLFYATYNVWAFLHLMLNRYHLVQANDLDTLLAARLACWFKRIPLIYDSHELFTEVPELIHRPRTQNVWRWLERHLVKGILYCSTVSQGVAKELEVRYGLNAEVIRNFPTRKERTNPIGSVDSTIIYQGALNVGRGLERLILAMNHIPSAKLILAGDGDIAQKLKELVAEQRLADRVTFLGRVPADQLHGITQRATIGVSLEEDMGLSYRYALPNKVFDYIQAALPVLVSNLPEMKALVDDYGCGLSVSSHCTPVELASKLTEMLNDTQGLCRWRACAEEAAQHLTWENERVKLLKLVGRAIGTL